MSMLIKGLVRPASVGFTGLGEQYRALKAPIDAAIQSVIERSAFIGGAELEEFEKWFAKFCAVEHAVGVSSGTAAIELSLRALGIGAGDEVVTAANTFIATAEAIAATGARPVFADVSERTGNLDSEQLARALSPRTRAILPVHLYGQPADMREISALVDPLGIPVVEDAAQAHGARCRGARAGSLGIAGCFSFYPTKNLGSFGDGGMVTTNNHAIAASVRTLRDHGRTSKYEHVAMGFTAKLDNLQAAVIRVQAERLDEWNARRCEAASWYRDELPPEVKVLDDPRGESVYHLFAVRVHGRDEFRAHLAAQGVETGIHYPVPLHLQPACRHLGYAPGDFPVSERLAREVVSLPMHPFLSRDAVRYVAEAAREFFQ
jgi:dTDP-4-amino-4,6-dideoxygalactose transaminase